MLYQAGAHVYNKIGPILFLKLYTLNLTLLAVCYIAFNAYPMM
jgi:hypothetical protein